MQKVWFVQIKSGFWNVSKVTRSEFWQTSISIQSIIDRRMFCRIVSDGAKIMDGIFYGAELTAAICCSLNDSENVTRSYVFAKTKHDTRVRVGQDFDTPASLQGLRNSIKALFSKRQH